MYSSCNFSFDKLHSSTVITYQTGNILVQTRCLQESLVNNDILANWAEVGQEVFFPLFKDV